MIPDDAVINIIEKDTTVKAVENCANVVMTGVRGMAGPLDPVSVEHFYDTTNPHKTSVLELVTEDGQTNKWLKVVDGKISDTEEVPLYIEDIVRPTSRDETISVDGETPGYTLARAVVFPLEVGYGSREGEHRLKLKGDCSLSKRKYYGTDNVGNVGMHPVPGEKVIP